jgi:hypothetical protein
MGGVDFVDRPKQRLVDCIKIHAIDGSWRSTEAVHYGNVPLLFSYFRLLQVMMRL